MKKQGLKDVSPKVCIAKQLKTTTTSPQMTKSDQLVRKLIDDMREKVVISTKKRELWKDAVIERRKTMASGLVPDLESLAPICKEYNRAWVETRECALTLVDVCMSSNLFTMVDKISIANYRRVVEKDEFIVFDF